jgi:hypothetical protein
MRISPRMQPAHRHTQRTERRRPGVHHEIGGHHGTTLSVRTRQFPAVNSPGLLWGSSTSRIRGRPELFQLSDPLKPLSPRILTSDLHVVKQPIEKRQRSCPWREWQVAGEDHAAAFAAFSDDVEEQLRLIRVRGLRKWRLEPQHPVRTPSRNTPEP